MLQGIKVRDVMMMDCPRLARGLTIRDLVDEYALWTIHQCFPITDGEHVLGIITLYNIKEIPRERWEATRVEEAMTPFDELKAVHPDDEVYTAIQQMTEAGVAQLPVVEDGQFVGVIARDNLMDFINTRTQLEA